jgi:aldehyde:ferredoxin oxidoreductase
MTMYGFMGKIGVIDLGSKTVRIIKKDASFYQKYMGGALLCAKLFSELTKNHRVTNAFSPENPIIFASGPMAAGRVCGATRVNVLSFSPETTGIYLSQAGGEFGPGIKRTGFDALAVTGESEEPVILVIENGQVRFLDAGHLWGKDRNVSYEKLRKDLGKEYSIASIGPGGEHRVRHANIMFEPDHYAGRGGLGAVLGAKKVKAIAVKGDYAPLFKSPETVKSINSEGRKRLSSAVKKSPGSFLGVLRNFGTFGLLDINKEAGNLPTRNFTYGAPYHSDSGEDKDQRIDSKEYAGRNNPCKDCFLSCKKRSKTKSDYTALAEYESAAILGANIGLEDDLETCLEACERCNRLGLDTISTGNIIAWLMDCFENNILTDKDLGFSIHFGDGQKAIDLIHDMACRKTKLGNLLADGIDQATDHLGQDTKPYLRSVKGLGMPAHIPHKKPGVGFGYFHGPNPTDHMKLEHDWIASDPDSLRAFNLNIKSSPDALDEEKVEVARITQIYYAAMDALSLCLFIFSPGNVYSFDEIAEMVSASTGFTYSFNDLMEIGEWWVQLQRKLYLDQGGEDAAFRLFLSKEIPRGPSKGAHIKKEDFETARRHYYSIMGWDENGYPEKSTLERLGI